MTTKNLNKEEFNEYYGRYIYKLSDDINLRNGFEIGKNNVISFFNSIPYDKLEYRYAPEKWTVKEVFQHLIDTERIFMYRCFRIARNDKTSLAGFNQEIYIEPSRANTKSLDALIVEFNSVRVSSIVFLNSLTDNDLCCIGVSNGDVMSARAAAFTIIGHDIWHMDVIKDKYL
jgi:hypothetical protein